MGHYASEMDPGWSESCEGSARRNKLYAKLKDVPLSKFKAKDSYNLANFFSTVNFDKVHETALLRFEKIAKDYHERGYRRIKVGH